jgi:hypothetical protein
MALEHACELALAGQAEVERLGGRGAQLLAGHGGREVEQGARRGGER